jgi:drug/metabolite transporter (DMT)-like permease
MDNKKRGPLLVFLASLLWAGDGPFRKPLLTGGLFVGFVSLLEHLFNTVVSLPGLWKNRQQFKILTASQIAGLLYIGAGASALAAILFVKGAAIMNYNFTVAALLQKFQPIFAIILAAIFLKEKIRPKFWLLAVPALIGAYLVTFGYITPSALWNSAGGASIKGPVLAVLAALLWAGGTVVGRSLLKDLNFQFVTGMRFVLGLLFLLVYVPVWEQMQFGLMTPLFWRNTLIIALLTGFFALLLYYYGLRNTKASVATLMELGYPLALTLINWKFLGIALSGWQIFGALLLLASVTVIVLYENSNSPQPNNTSNLQI